MALTKKAKLPSSDFLKNLCLPNFLPRSAAEESEIIKMEHEVTTIHLGNIRIHMIAEIKIFDAPFNLFRLLSIS